MKKISAILIISTLLSCNKSFLDNKVDNVITREKYVTDINTLEDYTRGIYLTLSQSYSTYITIYPEIIADNLKPVQGNSSLNILFSWKQQKGTQGGFLTGTPAANANGVYITQYSVITPCNFVIEKSNEFRSQNPAKADYLKAQALAIRALCHFNIVNAFSQSYNYTTSASHIGVYYNKKSEWSAQTSRRNSVKEVYDNMISDLTTSIELLPAQATNTLYVNKLFVKGLLARIYLFMNNYEESKKLSLEVISEKPLMSIENGYPDDMFKLVDFSKTENLLQLLPFNSASMNYSGGGIFAGFIYRGGNEVTATDEMVNIYSQTPNDIRNKWITKENNQWNITKFPTSAFSDVFLTSTNYLHSVMRSSELYLTASECYSNLNKEDSARYYLNIIRKRSDPTSLDILTAGQALRDSIYKERRKELAFEGGRMYDLLRLKKGVNRTDENITDAKTLPYPSNSAIAPIPQQEENLSGMQQNEGY